ncbi:putative laccase [Dioscorea sansibarensis]
MPTTALLQAHFSGQSKGVYSPDFPIIPLMPFNLTGSPPKDTLVSNGTKIVQKDSENYDPQTNPEKFNLVDPVERNSVGVRAGGWVAASFLADNLGELLLINYVDFDLSVSSIRQRRFENVDFDIIKTGVWFMHWHLEAHTSWGLKMPWVELDGSMPDQKLPPPPHDLPKC